MIPNHLFWFHYAWCLTAVVIFLFKCLSLPQVGRIIGKGGQNVRDLQRQTGSVIKLPQQGSTTSEETTVHIVGPFFSVQVSFFRGIQESTEGIMPCCPMVNISWYFMFMATEYELRLKVLGFYNRFFIGYYYYFFDKILIYLIPLRNILSWAKLVWINQSYDTSVIDHPAEGKSQEAPEFVLSVKPHNTYAFELDTVGKTK